MLIRNTGKTNTGLGSVKGVGCKKWNEHFQAASR